MKITLSTNGYLHKPKEEMSKAHFFTYDCNSLMQLLEEKITKGYMYAGHYDFQTTYFQFINKNEGEHIKKDHYVGTHLVSIDIDHSEVCLDDFYKTLKVEPSFAYESLSNREGNYCYRLVYAFEEEILGKQNYDYVLHNILNFLNIRTDKRAKDAYHIFYGTTPLAHTYCSNKLFKLSDFGISLDKVSNPVNYNYINKQYILKTHNVTGSETFDERLLSAIERYGYEDAYKKLQGKYRHYDSTPITLVGPEDERLVDIPQDYYEIGDEFRVEDGKNGLRKRINGRRRRMQLFYYCCIRRLIMPDCTANDLLYSLCYDMWRRIDNSEDPITLDELMKTVTNAMNYDITLFKYKRPGERKVNPAYRKKHNKTNLDVVREEGSIAGNERKKEIKENKKQLFLDNYNKNLSLQRNIEEITDKYGQKFGLSTVKRWLKEEGLTRPYKKRSVSPDSGDGGTTVQEEGEKPTESLKSGKNKVISLKVSKPYPKITDDEGFWMVEEKYLMYNFK